VDASRTALNALNPEVDVVALQSRLDPAAAARLAADADVVLDF
jgi:molybdopterin/thiamine biosynthesis adenylyltransferase